MAYPKLITIQTSELSITLTIILKIDPWLLNNPAFIHSNKNYDTEHNK